jgi:hypothetical protein
MRGFPKSFSSLAFLLFLFLPRVSLYGESIAPFVMPSARFAALGGSHAALSDDFYSLFTNPAAFVGVEEEYSIAEISFSGYGPIFEILDLVMGGDSGSLENLDLSGIIGPRGFAAGFDLGGPVALGWVGKGLGVGVFSRVTTDMLISGFTLRPAVFGEVLMVGGYSFRLLDISGHVFDIGFLGKGFFRAGINLDAPIFSVDELLDDPLGKEFKTYLGLGLDTGIKYTFAETLSAALVCLDLYSPALINTFSSFQAFQDGDIPGRGYAAVSPRLNLGLAWRVRSPFLDRYISGLVVMVDYHDFLDLAALIPRNPILNAGIGVELVVLNVLSLRAGIADALPAAGFGLDLTFARFDCSIYGRELGPDPGIQPVYAIDIGLLFRY